MSKEHGHVPETWWQRHPPSMIQRAAHQLGMTRLSLAETTQLFHEAACGHAHSISIWTSRTGKTHALCSRCDASWVDITAQEALLLIAQYGEKHYD